MSPTLPNMSAGNALNRPILSPSPMGLGRRADPALGRAASFGVLGGVARRTPMAPSLRRLISIKHFIRIKTWFTASSMHLQRTTAALFALLVHGSRRSWACPVDHAPTMASQLHREPVADPGSSRRVALWHRTWQSISPILPRSRTVASRLRLNRAPQMSWRARGAREALVVAQEMLISPGSPASQHIAQP